MKKIAVEEHFLTEEFIHYLRSKKDYPKLEIIDHPELGKIEFMSYSPSNKSISNLDIMRKGLDFENERLKSMDEYGIDMQVLSFNTSIDMFDVSVSTEMAKNINNDLSEITKKYPGRFAGLATLSLQDPESAAAELERSVTRLGLKGAKINSHVRGEYLDDKKFWVVFEVAEKLNVPIYLHPQMPSPDFIKPFLAYRGLAGPMWGYGAEVGLHSMRLICSGLFDKYPKLKIILGHLGEALPFWIWRIDNRRQKDPSMKLQNKLDRKPSDYIKDNFLITTSGMFWEPALLCAYLTLGADNIMFAVDYPWEFNSDGVKFMDAVQICDIDKEKIYHLNAEKYFNL
jgi:5-carboxyvanillate decarboxylase